MIEPLPHGWTAEEEAAFRAYGRRIFEREQEARFPRPGPKEPARRCDHAASGCNYPEGDCSGQCLAVATAKAA